MTDLTEQWKKGELPEETECYVRVNGGIYLGSIRYKNGCHNKKLPYVKSFNGQFITKHVGEILAEVPDYIEWQNMVNCACEEHKANTELLEENAQLKEVLHIIKRQCELLMPKNGLNPVGDRAVMKMFLTKIDEVIEDEI